MNSKRKPRTAGVAKKTKRRAASVRGSREAEKEGAVLYWLHDLIENGPFDLEEKCDSRCKTARRRFWDAAEGKAGAVEALYALIREQGARLSMDAAESELGALVRYYAPINKDSWRALLPLVASDAYFYAAKAARVLIMTHPEGVSAGALEVLAEIRRRFDYMNFADQSDPTDKQLAAAAVLRGVLMLGDVQLLGAARRLSDLIGPGSTINAVTENDEDGEARFDAPPNCLVVEFLLSCAEKEEPDSDAYINWLLYLLGLPKAHPDKPCLECYEHPLGRIAPLVTFVSYPDWVTRNQSRIRDLAYREVGVQSDTGVGYLFESWSSVKRVKPSKKQLAWQAVLEGAEKFAFRAEKTPPLKW